MKVALSMWSVHKYYFDGIWSVLDFLDFASSTKATGVELLSIFWRDQEKELPLVDEALKKHQLHVSSYAACNNFVSADAEYRNAQLKEVIDAVDMAVHFGINIVRVFTGDLPHDQSITYEEGIGYVLEGLSGAAKYAEEKGVLLCIENHGLFAGRSDQVIDVIQKVGSPALKSTFDTGNFLLVGQNPNDAVVELKDYIRHVHVKDFLKTEVEEPGHTLRALTGDLYLGKIPGDGEVDLAYLFSELNGNNYEGWLVVEFEGSEEPTEGSVISVDYVANLVESVLT
ncbi:AP endonuclease [Bacillus sp. SA1-12]|uniref:sugar phosphate isomerase/epimerase family protein n=1 Tax=Bacillus sp. SA1-12 TaxID=1455638 RepID=UPI000624FFFA|nr:sugar phosphate isomerase/epimerase family protein [Bacillus sp. SA1-12]KKI92094.1 AP endonuclease [Bacillus sp. SA1-12]